MTSSPEIRGHERERERLARIVAGGRVGSGYLFHGPEGVGKWLVAREFARAILCPNAPSAGGRACGTCSPCVRSAADTHRDFFLVEREEKKTMLSIEQIQKLARDLALTPVEWETKAAILRDVDRISEEAVNALLKTLEEPAPRTTLILVAPDLDSLLPTIRSRCQAMRFGLLPRATVVDVLARDHGVPAEEAEALADIAGGSPGRALRLRDLGYPRRAEETWEILAAAGGRDPMDVARELADLVATGGLADKRDRVREALLLLTDHVRRRWLAPDSPSRDPERAERCLSALARAAGELSLNTAPDSVLRACLIRLIPQLAS